MKRIVCLPGDGIGREVAHEAMRVLHAIDPAIIIDEGLIGAAAIDATGEPLPAATLEQCRHADGIFVGAVGDPRYGPDSPQRPEAGLLALRRELQLFANLRPVRPFAALADASPIRADRLADVNLLIVRELTGGIYFGDKREGDDAAEDACRYTADEVARITHVAIDLARQRRGRITHIDKANVLATSRLWRRTVTRLCAADAPDIALDHMLVDAAAMHLITRPAAFDVVLTDNLFGDILADECAVLAGSLGMLPSVSLGVDGAVLVEPVHGSAPDIAGRGIANPSAAILCVAELVRHAFGWHDAAARIEHAVEATIDAGLRTADIAVRGVAPVGTTAFTDAVLTRLAN
ncbi:MAG: 3-isopropylmalate dehydrogenase [Planctomycetota bacterium]